MVCAAERSVDAVIRAVQQGHCYASTGLRLAGVDVRDERITVETAGPCTGRFIGPGGVLRAESEGSRFEYRAAGEAHMRFEAEGQAGRLFLQPFFRDPG